MEYMLPSVFGWPASLFGVSCSISWAPSPSRPPRRGNAAPSNAVPTPEIGVVLEGGDEHEPTGDCGGGSGGGTTSSSSAGNRFETSPLPRVTAWYGACCEIPAFARTRERILTHWHKMVGTYPKYHAKMLAKVPKMPPNYP
jgi:hypothetical protein